MRPLRTVKIGADGEILPPDASNHVAIEYPDFGIQITATVINEDEETQDELLARARALTLAGHSDWDLPQDHELQLAIDRRFYEPALDPDLYRDIPLDWLWTKTYCAWAKKDAAGVPVSAWFVGAGGGGVHYGHRHNRGYALAVRRAGQ